MCPSRSEGCCCRAARDAADREVIGNRGELEEEGEREGRKKDLESGVGAVGVGQ
jgi:hypothetical protein